MKKKGSTEVVAEIPIRTPHFLHRPGSRAYGIIPRSRFLRKWEAAFCLQRHCAHPPIKMSTKEQSPDSKKRIWTVVSLLIIVPLGFYSKFYTGPAANWVNNSLSGVFYEIFWCVLLFLFLDNTKPWIIATSVLMMTCVLEFLQLWHPPFLEFIRSTFIGRAVLGTSFTWSDFPYYFLGCGVGWLWMRWLQNVDKSPSTK